MKYFKNKNFFHYLIRFRTIKNKTHEKVEFTLSILSTSNFNIVK